MLTVRLSLLRPKHGMYEEMEPLFANPILPLLAIALADEAFQDYSTFDILSFYQCYAVKSHKTVVKKVRYS